MKIKSWDITLRDVPGTISNSRLGAFDGNTVQATENDEFYTTDTEAFLIFNLLDEDFNPTSATITLHNRTDGSVVNEDVDVIDGTIAYEMREEVIEHAGGWQAQLVYEQDKGGVPEKYTSKVVGFNVAGHLLDTKEPTLVVIENWNNFVLTAEGTMERWESLEAIRKENENQRVAAETARQETFNDLIDTGFMQENINQKLAESEAEYAPRLTSLEQNDAELTAQLAQKVGGGKKAELEDLSATVLSAIEGGEVTSFELLSIPQDDSVTTAKFHPDIRDNFVALLNAMKTEGQEWSEA